MIMPYLSFEGDCEQAFNWYVEIFGGKILHMAKYGDMPDNPALPLTDEQKSKVMHAHIILTQSGGISGADALWEVEKGSAVSIQALVENEELAKNVFEQLSKDGTIVSKLSSNPPPDDNSISGCVKDKFGFTWIISAMK